MSWPSLIVWTLVCLALEGFFAGSELALVSADKLKLAHRAARGHKGARIALALARRPERLFSTTLLGQNLFIVANSTLITFFIFDRFGMEYEFFGLLLSPLVLIFGEAVPKSLFQQWADRLTPLVAPVVYGFSYVFLPVVWPLSRLTLWLMGGVQGSLMHGHEVTRDSLEFLLKESEAPRELSPVFKKSLLKILVFAKKETHEIMTPLIEVFSLRDTTTVAEAVAICREEGYSSFPIFQKRAYNIIGVIDFLALLFAKDDKAPITALMEPPPYVPPQMGVQELFQVFQERQKKFAVVVDEFGGAVGIVTLEDIVEAVLGQIQDEYDDERLHWKQVGTSQYLFEGRVTVDEINEKLRWSLPKGNYETLAGFLLTQFKKFPQTGDVFHFGNLTFLIKTATDRSIDEILVEIE
jgi:CBS domain containing-hemolysin-like protein